jgi:hypothetical protein
MQASSETVWRSPEEMVEIAFQRSSVVMMNEAHSELKRYIHTRQIGKKILPVAHQAGVRHLAMEALYSPTLVEWCNINRSAADDQTGYLA